MFGINRIYTMSKIVYFDYLRVIGAFAVVLLHTTAFGFRQTFPSTDWYVFTILSGFSRWGVPIFVMISGALFLNNSKELGLRRLFEKNIKRIVTSYLFWSSFYAIFVSVILKGNLNPIYILGRIVHGESHLWFLYMIIGLYMFAPVIKPFVSSRKNCEYFLFFSVLTTFVLPMIFDMVNYLFPTQKGIIDTLAEVYETIGLQFAAGYTGYFVIGHYLHQYVKFPQILSAFGRPGGGKFSVIITSAVLLMVVCVVISSNITGHANKYFFGNLRPFVLCISTIIFLYAKQSDFMSVSRSYIEKMASASFGIYLIHFLLIMIIESLGLYPYHYPILIPLYAMIVFIVSFGLSLLLYKIPFAKKYIL